MLCSSALLLLALSGSTILQTTYFKAPNAGGGDHFGCSVAVDGEWMVVGAPYENGKGVGVGADPLDEGPAGAAYGAVYVYRWSAANKRWEFSTYLKPHYHYLVSSVVGNFAEMFGASVDVDGDRIVVGAPMDSSNSIGIDSTPGFLFGDYHSGAAFVYHFDGTQWQFEAYLKSPNSEGNVSRDNWGDAFGRAVAISDDVVAVGAPNEASAATGFGGDMSDNSAPTAGAVYTYALTPQPGGGSVWTFDSYMKPTVIDAGDEFGESLSMDNGLLAVGAWGEDGGGLGPYSDPLDNSGPGSGAVYLFRRLFGIWHQEAYIKPLVPVTHFPGDDNWFFDSKPLDTNGGVLAVGNHVYDEVFVFEKLGTWSQSAHIQGDPGSEFGSSVALSTPGRLFVGAAEEDGSGYGVNPPEGSSWTQYEIGAVYGFMKSGGFGGSWDPTDRITAPHPDKYDRFGSCVSANKSPIQPSGGYPVAISARWEASSATIVDGDSKDNGAFGAGAVYYYDFAHDWGIQRYGDYGAVNDADLHCPTTPQLGGTLELEVRTKGTASLALCWISANEVDAPLFGGNLYVDLAAGLLGPASLLAIPMSGGEGSLQLAVPTSVAGLHMAFQAVLPEPSYPFGWALTNGLAVWLPL
jgi:hypothetical protein